MHWTEEVAGLVLDRAEKAAVVPRRGWREASQRQNAKKYRSVGCISPSVGILRHRFSHVDCQVLERGAAL